ncbi:MAG: hypothetical protein HC836_34435 [Richelia sp. RM2_1_2]|nr:hypothetical protein [Richelia sp. RM2_1_2]
MQHQELIGSVLEKLDRHNQIIEKQDQVIRLLQSQIQNLLSASADYSHIKANYIPPGWNASVWNKLPPQDKRHFRFLHHRRGFRPDYRNEMPLQELTEQFKQKQKDELKTAVVEVSPEEKQRLEALRLEALKLLREGENND